MRNREASQVRTIRRNAHIASSESDSEYWVNTAAVYCYRSLNPNLDSGMFESCSDTAIALDPFVSSDTPNDQWN